MNELLLRAVDGLAAGAACALVAAGIVLSLVVRRPVNLSMLVAPGAAMLIGGWVGGLADTPAGAGILFIAVAGTIAACCGIWLVVDQFVERPLRSVHGPHGVIVAAGVLLLGLVVIERAATLWPIAPGDVLIAAAADPEPAAARLVMVDSLDMATWIVVAVVLAALLLVMTRTKMGLAMRAVGYRPQTAGLLGINTERLIATAVVIAAGLAALGGLLYGVREGRLDMLALMRPGLVAAVALVVSGTQRPLLAVAAAAGLGAAESFAGTAWPAGAAVREAILVIIGLVAVLARPAEWRGDGVAAA